MIIHEGGGSLNQYRLAQFDGNALLSLARSRQCPQAVRARPHVCLTNMAEAGYPNRGGCAFGAACTYHSHHIMRLLGFFFCIY